MTALVLLLLVLVIGAFAMIVTARARIEALDQRIAALEDAARAADAAPSPAPAGPEPARLTPAAPAPVRADTPPSAGSRPAPAAALPARIVHTRQADQPPPPPPPPDPEGSARFADFESVVGGRLPIWVGGTALALAAFFLVRYAIEAALFGPGLRVLVAGGFGLALIAAAEAARRLPATADDPRIGQSLAGAGIASLYGTLYMAGELYGLIAAATAFVLLLAVTALALGLSLRQGPPTAAMGLIGGFAAPLVTQVGDRALPGLLAYLAIFTAALFALAARQGWTWLAIAATAAAAGWALWLLAAIDGAALAWVGPFVLALAIGAAIVLGRSEPAARARWVPLGGGLLLLALLGVRLDYSPLAWGFQFSLVVGCLGLAVRDPACRPAAWGALALTLLLLHAALATGGGGGAALTFALLGTACGHWLLGRERPLARIGAAYALAAALGPALLARTLLGDRLTDPAWAALLLVAAAAAAALAAMMGVPSAAAQVVPAAPPLDGTLLSISATGRVSRTPDIATVRAGVVTQGQGAAGALSENASRMAAVIAALKAAGIAARDISTSNVALQPQYRYTDGQPPAITGYQASNTVAVRFRDIAKAGAVLDALVKAGANQIDGPSLALAQPDAALDAARTDAVAKARARAALYAQAAGLRVERIVSIDESGEDAGGSPQPPVLYRARAMMADAAPTQVLAGETDVTVTLSVKFLLK